MSSEHTEPLVDIVGEAMALPRGERAAYVRSVSVSADACDEALSLIASLEGAGGFMESPTMAGATSSSAWARLDVAAGSIIGHYRLLEQIGEGGFGVVFSAEQREPVRRTVAVKVLKLGMDTREVIARFEAERQTLALMTHPGIATVFDAGATDSGRPFFVMELVRGEPITNYCRAKSLPTRQRLEVFRDVCRAVQHAHTKGIIHRDLKPGNVLVSDVDGSATPKVIDFGIAKATGARLTDQTVHTLLRQFVGTPEYISPEQTDGTAMDIDARSDIYSLGVLLYELLTGVTPLDPERLRSAPWNEFQRIIREEEPLKPSTRLGTIGAAPRGAPGDAAQALAAPTAASLVRGDLDWIVMRCLEKDRSRRYPTADALAADVQRHLSGEPVEAAPPSTAYRARKFVRRHGVAVTAGGCVLAALVLGFGVALWQARIALAAKAGADRQREQTERVVAFQAAQLSGISARAMGTHLREAILAGAARALAGSGVSGEEAHAATLRLTQTLADANMTSVALESLDKDIFTRALDAAEKEFQGQPIVRAALMQTLATTLREVGLLERAGAPQAEALAIRRAELGEDHPETLHSALESTKLLRTRGKLAESEAVYRDVVAKMRRVLGEESRETIVAIGNLGELLQLQGRFPEAEVFYREAVDKSTRVLGVDDPDTIAFRNNIGFLYYAQGRLSDAATAFADSLASSRRVRGPDDEGTLAVLNNLASVYQAQGDLTDAEAMFREGLERSRRARGDDHPATMQFINNMGHILYTEGRLPESEPFIREALDRRRRILGADHWDTLQSMNNMGLLLRDQGQLAQAEEYFRETLERRQRASGPDHPATMQSMSGLATLLRRQGRLDEAEPLLREALERRRRVLGNAHPDTLQSLCDLGMVLMEKRRVVDAEPLFREALAGRDAKFGKESPSTADARVMLAETLAALGRYEDAEPMLVDAEKVLRGPQVRNERRARCVRDLVALYNAWETLEPGRGHAEASAAWASGLAEEHLPDAAGGGATGGGSPGGAGTGR